MKNAVLFFAAIAALTVWAGATFAEDVIDAGRAKLDNTNVYNGRSSVFQCYFTGSYDHNAWDKNLDPTLRANVLVKRPQGRFLDDAASQIEIVQWSWAERARCQRAIRSVDTSATAILALGYLVANEIHKDEPKSITDTDLSRIGVIVLLPLLADDLRGIEPRRRFYTGAVFGTSLMSWRNNRLDDALTSVQTLQQQALVPASLDCHLTAPPSFELRNSEVAGIESLQAKLTVDVEAYRTWCNNFSAVRGKVLAIGAQSNRIRTSFTADRFMAWRGYENIINNGAYDKQAGAVGVLHRVLALPALALTDVIGGKSADYQLVDQRPSIDAADVATLPVLGGDYELAPVKGDLIDLAISINSDLEALSGAVRDYSPVGKALQTKATQDLNLLSAFDGGYLDRATRVSTYYYQVSDLFAQIRSLNTQKNLLLDINAGTAYLSTVSASEIKKSTPVAEAVSAADKTASGQ